MFTLLINELNNMAKDLGYDDVLDYWSKTKGEQYAKTGALNIKNLIDSFSDRGAD